jgi:hypothetical protein
MGRNTLGRIVILALGILVASLAVEAQPAGKVYHIGVLERTSMALTPPTSRPSAAGCGNAGTLRGRTSSSSTARPTGATNGSQTWRRSWCACRWT